MSETSGSPREQRLVFGEDAELYDRARPSYPGELLDDVVALTAVPPRTVDVGAGTGKATVQLAERGASGVAVEAHPAMAGIARRRLSGYPGWRVEVCEFESWQPAPDDHDADLVTCAQAWHWLDPDVRIRKADTVLRDGGWLALFWNRPGEDRSALRVEIESLYRTLEPDLPVSGIGGKGRPPADDIPSGLSFGEPVERQYSWTRPYTAEEYVALMRTQSNHRLLPAERAERLLSALVEVIERHGGVYEHRYSTWLWAAQKLG